MSTQNFNVETGLSIGNVVANAAANSLTTSGNITAGNLAANMLLSTVNLSVTGTSNLGPIGNITITGGAIGQYLQTNGSGNLSWVNPTGNGTVGSGTANQLAYYSASGNTISTSGANLTWNGADLLTIIGNANVGNITVTSNANVGNIGATAAVITANATFGNINSVSGILSVTGNANVGNVGAVAGVFTGSLALKAPVTVTGATYTMLATDSSLIINASATCTVTLLAPATYPGRILNIKTVAAYTVVSAGSNVVPVASTSAGTAILAATAGKWALLQSDGTNWVTMLAG